MHYNNAIHSVFLSDCLVILWHERPIEGAAIFRDPINSFGPIKVPEMNMGVD